MATNQKLKKDILVIFLRGFMMPKISLLPAIKYAKDEGLEYKYIGRETLQYESLLNYKDKLIEIVNKADAGKRIVCVGFSYGGIVALMGLLDPSIGRRIIKSYTICSPVKGVEFIPEAVANYTPSKLGQLAKDVTKQNDIIDKINNADKATVQDRLVCYYHNEDIISPPRNAVHKHGEAREIKYSYSRLTAIAAHQLATIDTRVIKEIIYEIKGL